MNAKTTSGTTTNAKPTEKPKKPRKASGPRKKINPMFSVVRDGKNTVFTVSSLKALRKHLFGGITITKLDATAAFKAAQSGAEMVDLTAPAETTTQ